MTFWTLSQPTVHQSFSSFLQLFRHLEYPQGVVWKNFFCRHPTLNKGQRFKRYFGKIIRPELIQLTWKKLQAVLADIMSEITLFWGLFEQNIPFFLLRMEKEELKMENLGWIKDIWGTGCPEKNAPQFLLNFSCYKHAKKLQHNSLERWDP